MTLDYGDIQMLRALLSAAQFMGYTLNANNFSVVMPTDGKYGWRPTAFTFQSVLAAYPSLLTMQNTADLASSKSALTNAIAHYFAASGFHPQRAPAGATNRLFKLDTNDVAKEAKFRTDLTNALLSLNTPTEFNTNNSFLDHLCRRLFCRDPFAAEPDAAIHWRHLCERHPAGLHLRRNFAVSTGV